MSEGSSRETADVRERETDLSQIDIRVNMLVEVLNVQNVLAFVGRVKEFDGNSLTIRDARDDFVPPVMYNQDVKLRFYHEGESLVLHGKINGSSRLIWRVDRLEKKFGVEKRAAFRQNVSVDASVQLLVPARSTTMTMRKTGVTMSCKLLDISVGGLLIRCPANFQPMDRIRVSGIKILENSQAFSFQCMVRRIQVVRSNFLCGCQFENLTTRDEDRLLQAIFAVQREHLRRQRGSMF